MPGAAEGPPRETAAADAGKGKIGRPVRIITIGRGQPEQMAEVVDREASSGADLIVLPEAWPGLGKFITTDHPLMKAMAALAKKHHTYIISPIDRQDGDIVYNTAVLIDRQGKIAGMYDKVFPVLPDPPGQTDRGEFGSRNGRPGRDALVFETDFGRIGMATCFDGQFPEVWHRLEDNGAQLVLFSSFYSGGRALGAYAMLHHYYVVSCINGGECQAYDMTGEKLLDELKGLSRITLDMDRCIFHHNDYYNHWPVQGKKLEKFLKENPGVVIDKMMLREEWYVLKATQPGVDVPALTKQYDLQDLRTYLRKQREQSAALRGFDFKRLGPPAKAAN